MWQRVWVSGEDLSDAGEGGGDCEILEDQEGLLTELVEQLFIVEFLFFSILFYFKAIDNDKDDFLSG